MEHHTELQLLDFYPVTEYLDKASLAVYPRKTMEVKRKKWLSDRCSQLKHEINAGPTILDELKELTDKKLPKAIKEDLESTLTYFSNNISKGRMNYAQHMKNQLPIGSDVTEAACNTLVKQRLCGSGSDGRLKEQKLF